ncbi:MAG TPA: ABC transporter ATP-binding protein [Chloroflexota bacterium]|nr:ABC transporter ATP-binding protein [Chloroflexota bacterium]
MIARPTGLRGGGANAGGGLDDVPDVDGVVWDSGLAKRALAYTRPYRGQLLWALFLTTVATLMSVLAPYLVKVAIDEHIAVGDIPGLSVIMVVTLIVYLINYVASARQIVIMSQVGQEILMTVRAQLFRHLQKLPLGYFHRVPTGVTVSRLINDVLAMNEVLTNGLLSLFTDILLLFSTMAIMLYLSPRLALVTFAVMPIMVVAIWIFTERAKVAYRRTRQTVGAVAAGFQENVDGVRVVQAFSREEVNEDQFDRLNDDNRQANISANTLSSGLMPVIECANALATVAVVWYGGSLVLAGDGEVTLGVLVAFLTYVTRFFQPIRELTQFYNQLQAAMAGAEKVFELLDEPVTLSEKRNPISLEAVKGDIAFKKVGFGYNVDDRLVLRDVSFEIPAGTMTALVGHTGAGKTTISALLARFYDPSEGAVLLDGHDLRDLSFATLRSNMAVVLQDNFLFAGSIADNIRYGRPDATDEQIVEAAKLAHAHEFITRFPNGYDTQVMERAANLSLGQRQLIAIARAVLADPKVLILDEATSNVDPRTEVRLQQALNTLLAGRTSLVVAHRLSTIRAADQVLVVDGGEIVERGRHEELLQRRGAYYRLYQQQFAPADESAPAEGVTSLPSH